MKNIPYTPDDIDFLFSKDTALLQEYFKVRDAVYLEHFNLPTADIIHDEYDEQDYTEFLIVRDKKTVVGGARLIFHQPGSGTLMPFEADDFKLVNVLPQLDLRDKIYCEVDRTVLYREYRNGDLGREIVRQSAYRSKARGADYLFTVNPPVQARNNKRHCSALGIDFNIREDIDIPDRPAFNKKKMWLTVTDLSCPVPSANSLFKQMEEPVRNAL